MRRLYIVHADDGTHMLADRQDSEANHLDVLHDDAEDWINDELDALRADAECLRSLVRIADIARWKENGVTIMREDSGELGLLVIDGRSSCSAQSATLPAAAAALVAKLDAMP